MVTGLGLLLGLAVTWAGDDTGTALPATQPASTQAVEEDSTGSTGIAKLTTRLIGLLDEGMKSADVEARKQAIQTSGPKYAPAGPEWIAFFKRAFKDESPVVRGRAILKLYNLWVDVPMEDLPRKFTGFHDGQMIDRDNPKLIAELIEQCGKGDAAGGYAAYVLGLLRAKEAIPVLKALGRDQNIFARYTAGRALIASGAADDGRAILESLIAEQISVQDQIAKGQISPVDEKGYPRTQPSYVVHASRTLITLGPKDRETGLRHLVRLMWYLEKGPERADFGVVQEALAAVTGKQFDSAEEAQAWLDKIFPERPPTAATQSRD
jgi:hypothetical protein